MSDKEEPEECPEWMKPHIGSVDHDKIRPVHPNTETHTWVIYKEYPDSMFYRVLLECSVCGIRHKLHMERKDGFMYHWFWSRKNERGPTYPHNEWFTIPTCKEEMMKKALE